MAMVFEVVYPSGERAIAIGYPGATLRVDVVPPGPESCLYDELEVDFTSGDGTPRSPHPVVRVIGGPRRPTHRVRVPGGVVVRERWMEARDAEGWSTLDNEDPDPDVVWVVALKDDLDPATLGDVIPR